MVCSSFGAREGPFSFWIECGAMTVRRVAKPAPAKKRKAPVAKAKADGRRTFWDDLADIGKRVPAEELALLPSAANFDEEFDPTSGG